MRLIDADKVEGIFKEACKTAYFRHNPQVKDGASAFMDCIRGLDTIDPGSLRPKARWLKISVPFNTGNECSNCGWGYSESKGFPDFKFCPNCGAKMYLEVK